MRSLGTGSHYGLVVLGGGGVGVKAATEAASRGQRVAIIEPLPWAQLTGAPTGAHSKCLRDAVLNGARSWPEIQEHLDGSIQRAHHMAARQLRTFHVEVLQGHG